jgi:photosystem II P680 reaction center D1 protein
MTATLERRDSISVWEQFSAWITSTENRLYIAFLCDRRSQAIVSVC